MLPKMKNGFLKYVLFIPVLVAVVGGLLLAAVALIPSDALWENAFSSALELLAEFNEDTHLSPAARKSWSQDIYTDSLIIESAYSMGPEHFDNVLLNRIVPGGARPVRLIELLEGNAEANQAYSRYWMGFRVLIRPMLLFMTYYEMRALAGIAVFILLAAVTASTAKRRGIPCSLAIIIAFLMMEPWAVCSSLQFSCCFILMLLLMLLINCADMKLDDRKTLVVFCLFGALTQFFDFYTYPLIVCAAPCLLLVCGYDGEKSWIYAAKLITIWLVSWFAMWILKQLIAAAVCGGAELLATLESVAFRFGVGGHKDETLSYSIKDAFYRVWYHLTDVPMKLALLAAILFVAALLIVAWRRRGKMQTLVLYLAISALPLLWMAATPQPIYIHYWFQYRSLYVSFFGLILFASEALLETNPKVKKLLWK